MTTSGTEPDWQGKDVATAPSVIAGQRTEGESGLRRTSLSHIRLRTRDLETTVRFYERTLGLVQHDPSGRCDARLGWGAGHHVIDLLDGDPGLDGFAFEVLDPGGLPRLAERLSERGHDPAEPDRDQATLALRDPDGTWVEFHGAVNRAGEHSADPGRRPVRVQHVTLSTQNMESMVEFYRGLGFHVSDRMGDVFTWLRSTVEHHSLAIVRGPAVGLDHYSYDVSSWADFKVWCDRLADLDVAVRWGPGRHGPGNNLFIFFEDPDGNRVELSAEMERFWDDRATYVPRIWDAAPLTINLWGGQLAPWRTTH